MKITFHHPPALDKNGKISSNPFNDFDPANKQHYPIAKGIYIYGLKLKVNGIDKFVPFYVGITGIGANATLSLRLIDHYNKNRSGGNGKKELWDFSKGNYSIKDIYSRYSEMNHYDYFTSKVIKVRKSFSSYDFISELQYLRHLIYYQNCNFFQLKTSLPYTTHINNINQNAAIKKYPLVSPLIAKTKNNFDDNYYFIYASEDEIKTENKIKVLPSLTDIELATKKALNIIG
ncbi:MAG: hypothetical protein ACKOX3_09830, partial [Bacteroidota bacterium]